ncbi:hypothetical protein [Streptosporangium canum]|uniref:hypothetical protein n=1 Tax=Streptosporangium canum TaxID=324952 RepID=UPI0037BB7D78
MSKRVGPTDMRRMRQRRIAALIAKSRRGTQTRSPEQVAFTTLLHRLKKKNRARPGVGVLAGSGVAR